MGSLTRRDRDICELLGTNPTDLQEILKKSRQTITKHIEENLGLFSVNDVVRVAERKIRDEAKRARVVSDIMRKYYPDVLRYTRDFNVERFSKYCILGMYIHPEIISNPIFARFVTNILSDESKFVLFVCLPQKQYVQLQRWLDLFVHERRGKTAQFVALPCKLVELLPIQILADPWSNDPKLVSFNEHELYVDEANSNKAIQLANALKEYGVSWEACETIDDDNVRNKLIHELNRSFYEPGELTDAFISPSKKAQSTHKMTEV